MINLWTEQARNWLSNKDRSYESILRPGFVDPGPQKEKWLLIHVAEATRYAALKDSFYQITSKYLASVIAVKAKVIDIDITSIAKKVLQ